MLRWSEHKRPASLKLNVLIRQRNQSFSFGYSTILDQIKLYVLAMT